MGYAAKEMKRLMGKSISRWRMVEEGDRILVAVSGGKDSLSVLWLLRERIKRIPIDYEVLAIHVDPGFGADSAGKMAAFFQENGFEYRAIKSDCGPRAHGAENLENPCFLCSRLRRKAIFEAAGELRCNKIAFGHHKDDVIETLFINLFYGASISTMKPVQEFFDGKIMGIRPLYLVEENLVSRYARDMGWQKIDLGCPTDGASKRSQVREMLGEVYRGNRKVKGNIFHALCNVRPDYLP